MNDNNSNQPGDYNTTCIVCTWNTRTEAYADSDGTVRVYDPIAGHFTVCHSLTPNQERRVRRLTQPKKVVF